MRHASCVCERIQVKWHTFRSIDRFKYRLRLFFVRLWLHSAYAKVSTNERWTSGHRSKPIIFSTHFSISTNNQNWSSAEFKQQQQQKYQFSPFAMEWRGIGNNNGDAKNLRTKMALPVCHASSHSTLCEWMIAKTIGMWMSDVCPDPDLHSKGNTKK